jgi:hypothetical protein
MDFLKITSTLTRPTKNLSWFSVGNAMSEYFGIHYGSYIKQNWVFPGYLVFGTDIAGVRDSLVVTLVDDLNCIWTRYWYDKTYYDRFLADDYIQKVQEVEDQYRQKNGLIYRETFENYAPKSTKNGYHYLGNHYIYSTHLNS